MTGITFAIFLLLLELAIRLLTSTEAPLFQNHAVLGKTFVPSVSTTRFVAEGEREISFRFNREGFRDENRPYEKPAGVQRIAVLGDSMIAAMAVDEEDTLVRLVEEKLKRSHTDTTWEVMNCAISGAGPGQSLVVYREAASRYDPDIVLFAFYVGNDLGDSSRELTSSRHRIYFKLDAAGKLVQLPHSRTRSNVSVWLNRHSRLYVWQKFHVDLLRSRMEEAMDVMPTGRVIFQRNPAVEVERAWEILEALIGAMKREVEADGARFAVVVLPAAEQILDERWEELLELSGPLRDGMDPDNPEERLRSIGLRAGLPVLTLVEPFREAAPHRSMAHEDEWLHFNANGHFNDAGHLVAANALYEFLTTSEIGLVPAPAASAATGDR